MEALSGFLYPEVVPFEDHQEERRAGGPEDGPGSPAGQPTWERRAPALPRQPCSSPRTAAAPPTAAGSGQGYRDLTAEIKVGSSKRPDGGGWGWRGETAWQSLTQKSLPAFLSPQKPTHPLIRRWKQKDRRSGPGRNCCCHLHHQPSPRELCSPAGSPTTCCSPPPAPRLLHHTGLLGLPRPTPHVLFMPHGMVPAVWRRPTAPN